MQLTPLIAVHLTAALAAIAIGPVALWARKAGAQRPQLHRAVGYAWVTLMLLTATSAIFIRDYRLPNIEGYTPIHLFIPVVYGMLFLSFRFLAKRDIARHRKTMQRLYLGACVAAGTFTLLPGRHLGNLVFGQWLGLTSTKYQPSEGTPMIAQILINTPFWVWGLLAGLLVIGFSQSRNSTVGLRRVIVLPLGMGALSLHSTLSTFGASPLALGSWLATASVLMLAVSQLPVPAGARYDSASRQFQLPCSWIPMALIMDIFLTKYAVGVSLAMHPELKSQTNFSLVIVMLYGLFSGIFTGRAVRLLRLAMRPATDRLPVAINA